MAERYINAYDLAETIENLDITVAGKPARWNDAKYTVLDEIATAPDADVVEVVRCKDCIHWGGVTYGFVCRKFSGIDTKICMGADHFCSFGERSKHQ